MIIANTHGLTFTFSHSMQSWLKFLRVFNNPKRYPIRKSGRGWQLVDGAGKVVAESDFRDVLVRHQQFRAALGCK